MNFATDLLSSPLFWIALVILYTLKKGIHLEVMENLPQN
mgnify:CR=1 FL=1